MSRFWLVELHDDLTARGTTRTGVWSGVHGVNGVHSITDLDAISSETLDSLLRDSGCTRVFTPDGTWHWEHSTECLTPRASARKRTP